jgi:stage IV sporulation protein FB
MSWSYRIARVAGTDIKLHLTFLAFVAWVGWGAYSAQGPAAAASILLFIAAVFVCILLHEFGHILTARRFGVRTPDVILLPIGGVARLERMPTVPRQELLIALGGPAVTLAIVAVLYAVLRARGDAASVLTWTMQDLSVAGVMQLNLWLLAFNMIPAFPMDGGRVLRALLAMRLGLERATRIAAGVGQVLAVAMGTYAVFGGRWNWLLVLIAVFIFFGAGAEATAVRSTSAGAGLDVRRMMVTDFRTIPIHASLADAVDLLLAGEQREFPVIDNWGRVEGLLTRDHLVRGLAQLGAGGGVRDAMAASPPAVAPEEPFEAAVDRLRASRLPALPVIDASGRLVGLLTTDNISDVLMVRRAEKERREARREK